MATKFDPEIYQMLDRAKLTPADLMNSRKSMQTIVTEIRVKIVEQFGEFAEGLEKNRKITTIPIHEVKD